MSLSIKPTTALFLFLGAAVVAPLTSGCVRMASAPAEAVSSYEPFEASDKSVTGEAPAGWEKESGDTGGTLARVNFTKGDAKIRIRADAGASFMADAMKNGPVPVIDAMHEKGIKQLEEFVSDPQAMPAQPMTSPIGEARYSEFTADGGQTHGYRSTAIGPQRVISVTASCPEKDWETLKPAFSKVIGSIANGSGP